MHEAISGRPSIDPPTLIIHEAVQSPATEEDTEEDEEATEEDEEATEEDEEATEEDEEVTESGSDSQEDVEPPTSAGRPPRKNINKFELLQFLEEDQFNRQQAALEDTFRKE
ncbi:hypothetical protein NQZ68_033694 [Dissostichus eleginoides]|nr:hypothetical protein NQZ68_033694 [Dissostichus eleginoides]